MNTNSGEAPNTHSGTVRRTRRSRKENGGTKHMFFLSSGDPGKPGIDLAAPVSEQEAMNHALSKKTAVYRVTAMEAVYAGKQGDAHLYELKPVS